jgi:hypothetical protein
MLVGLPYWPNKKISTRLFQKIRIDPKNRQWLGKSFLNMVYAVTRPHFLYVMYKSMNNPLQFDKTIQVIAVRNKRDAFISKTAFDRLAQNNNWQLHVFAGYHDDIWENPEPYIQLLENFKQ